MNAFAAEASLQAKEFSSGNLAPAAGTRHHRLLNSNEVPLDSEISTVKSTGSRLNAQLVDIGEEIARLDRRLEELKDEHQSLIRLRAQNVAILSPLRRIPPEVLVEIFMWTLPPLRGLPTRICKKSPWLLTHISRHWRAVATSTPSLWSTVAISYHPGMDPGGLYPLPMLETQISRALTLKIHFYGNETSDPGPQLEVFKYLSSYSSRWEELSLSITSALALLLSDLQDRVPSLRRLFIQWGEESGQADMESLTCFDRAPSLRCHGAQFLPLCPRPPANTPAHTL
ncbi:hypothetical protein B0H16DRAFT_135196 [Mycena metata]|uniref:F-box domain-containing protein n=1 Tax=Mycena metata TaxID=1033252 RepID=A0AAD7I5W7_9AGAR|nr:hypothetical protein B0H16DRAFT_135196 [Mycena metata]